MLAAMIMGAAAAAGSREERQPASGDGLGPDWRGTAGHSEMWAEAWLRLWRLRAEATAAVATVVAAA